MLQNSISNVVSDDNNFMQQNGPKSTDRSSLKSPITRNKSPDLLNTQNRFCSSTARFTKVNQAYSPHQSHKWEQKLYQKLENPPAQNSTNYKPTLACTILGKDNTTQEPAAEPRKFKKAESEDNFENNTAFKITGTRNLDKNAEVNPPVVKVSIAKHSKAADENPRICLKVHSTHNERKRDPILEGETPKAVGVKPKPETTNDAHKMHLKKSFLPSERADHGSPTKKSAISRVFYDRMALNAEPVEEKTKTLHPSNKFGRDMKSIINYDYHSPKTAKNTSENTVRDTGLASPIRNRLLKKNQAYRDDESGMASTAYCLFFEAQRAQAGVSKWNWRSDLRAWHLDALPISKGLISK